MKSVLLRKNAFFKQSTMGAVMFMSLGLLFLMSIPIITSRLAKRMGRDPRRWFLLAMILPLIATVILVLLPDLSEQKPE